MNKYILIDSGCNLTKEFLEEHDFIKVIGIPVNIDGEEFLDEPLNEYISKEDFYNRLKNGDVAKTSLISPARFKEKFEELSDKPVYYIGFSSGMSGTFQSSILAKAEIEDNEIHLIDTLSASVGVGNIVLELVDKLKEDKELDIVEFVNKMILNVNHYFIVDDLMYLKRGGRIPAALATIASVINLKPVMTVDKEGKLISEKKVRGRKRAIKYMIDKLDEKMLDSTNRVMLSHTSSKDDIEDIKAKIIEKYKDIEVIINEESPTIGSHIGPGLLVISFIGKER